MTSVAIIKQELDRKPANFSVGGGDWVAFLFNNQRPTIAFLHCSRSRSELVVAFAGLAFFFKSTWFENRKIMFT